ncbi:hypothetical protein EV356DRAFT_495921 [Viridothelium virens]|uniref:Uncharacterized protein n=1 Tax=Viridothelium virens TaxID=1048519 RepID=A0A6A6HRJ4_VIRVR|nr:hypothetical protein EV356DRAFT_495921 [Viridothelium virens]
MPHPSRIYPSDEELGKRNDDYRPKRVNSWLGWRTRLMQYRKRRIVALLVAGFFTWVIWTSTLGSSGIGPLGHQVGKVARIVTNMPELQDDGTDPIEPTGPPPRITDEEALRAVEHYFSGPIRFFRLADSLHAISKTYGHRTSNRNVLFAAANLKSAGTLLPMACEMAKTKRNFVHIAIMGRDGLTLQELKEINGINDKDCSMYWHDARPDYSKWSTDGRMSVSVSAGLNHMNQYMHPQALFIDGSSQEDAYFSKAITTKANTYDIPIIKIPDGKLEDFRWATRLDSGSLNAWYKPVVDILVHAPPKASGSLIRLLRSLEKADYSGLPPPRLTIDLPPDAEEWTKDFINKFVWPPRSAEEQKDPRKRNELRLNHRIARERVSPEDASVRFIESFYPSKTSDSHVLLLSAQAELSPRWYHYLYYTMLQHHYSPYQPVKPSQLAGISLENPSLHLDGSTSFKSPAVADVQDEWYSKYSEDSAVPFLWQAPNANAALYFGDKWAELQSFLTHRLVASNHAKAAGGSSQKKKLISSTQPAWTEYLLELMRIRSYGLLYPGTSDSSDALVTVHRDLSRPAEEFDRPPSDSDSADESDSSEAFVPNPEDKGILLAAESLPFGDAQPASQAAALPLHALLPFDGELPELPHIPMLSYDGHLVKSPFVARSAEDLIEEEYEASLSEDDPDAAPSSSRPSSAAVLASRFARTFRTTIGGCTSTDATRVRKVVSGSARDLFCFDDGTDNQFEDPSRVDKSGEPMPPVDPKDSWTRWGEVDEEAEKAKNEQARREREAKDRADGKGIKWQDVGKPGWDRLPTVEEAAGGRAGGDEVAEAVQAANA